MRALILELHIYRSTANVVKGRELFEGLSTVEGDCLLWREAVVAQRQPRPLFVMGNTVLENADGKGDETISWVNYEATKEGLIQSWTDRNIWRIRRVSYEPTLNSILYANKRWNIYEQKSAVHRIRVH